MAKESKNEDYQKFIENNEKIRKPLPINPEGHNRMLDRLDIDEYTILSEAFGNLKGKNLYIDISLSNGIYKITIYCTSDTWTEKDKESLHTFYESGNNKGTASINGIGIKMILREIIDLNGKTTYIIKNEKGEYLISTFGVENKDGKDGKDFKQLLVDEWEPLCEKNEIFDKYYNYLKLIKDKFPEEKKDIEEGTFIEIELNKEWGKKLIDDIETYKNFARKFFNRSKLKICFNGTILNQNELCEDYIELNINLCWDTKTPDAKSCSNEFLEITNYDEIKLYYPFLKQNIHLQKIQKNIKQTCLEKNYNIKYTKVIKETFKIRVSLLEKEKYTKQSKDYGSLTNIRGTNIYFGDMCLSIKGFFDGYGGREKNNALGASHWGKEGDELHERIEVELLTKNSMIATTPKNKKEIKLTSTGIRINKFIALNIKLHPDTKNKKNFKPSKEAIVARDKIIADKKAKKAAKKAAKPMPCEPWPC